MRAIILAAICMTALAGCHSSSTTVSFTPAALKDCSPNANPPAVIDVHWDASKANPKGGVVVRVTNDKTPVRTGVFGGAPGTPWTAGNASGSATTGEWVFAGTTFFVTEAASGDVLARFLVRAREVQESVSLLLQLLDDAGADEIVSDEPLRIRPNASGLGLVEGWRGTIAQRVEVSPDKRVSRLKIVDPSFFNWPALPVSLVDTIVPDFPLVNKSFNLSYAGNDL